MIKALIIDDKLVIHINNSELHKILTDTIHILNLLKENGFEVFVPLLLPANDGGIALGQLAIAAKHRALGII